LLNALKVLDSVKMDYPDEQTGVAILRKALEMPIRKIAENAGQDGAVILAEVRRNQVSSENTHLGYDVMTGEFMDMLDAGIIDPAKVTKGALLNAASVAAMVLSTEALITDIPEPEPPAPAGPPGGGMY
jgi:chaperonin GroEL